MRYAKLFISLIILLSVVPIIFLITSFKSETRKNCIIEDKNGNVILLQVLYGQGDYFYSNVVNLYFKKKDEDFWRWYYVEHETFSRNWNLQLDTNHGKVLVNNRGKTIGILDTSDRSYLLNGKIHSRGKYGIEFLVEDPYNQNYPVIKTQVDPEG